MDELKIKMPWTRWFVSNRINRVLQKKIDCDINTIDLKELHTTVIGDTVHVSLEIEIGQEDLERLIYGIGL